MFVMQKSQNDIFSERILNRKSIFRTLHASIPKVYVEYSCMVCVRSTKTRAQNCSIFQRGMNRFHFAYYSRVIYLNAGKLAHGA